MDTGPSGRVPLLAALTWPRAQAPAAPPGFGHQHPLPFSKYAEAPRIRQLRSRRAHPRPAARPFPAPARAQTALRDRRRSALPGPAAPARPDPASPATSRPGRDRPWRGAHPRAGGRLPRARQRRAPRRPRGPQGLGPGGLRVHAQQRAARRPGRGSTT